MQIWTGEKSPDELAYYKQKYDCLKVSGVKHGGDYCRDINKHTDNSTKLDLFKCYRKYGVDYSEELCDFTHKDNDQELLKCYEAKDVPNNEKYCDIVHEGKLEDKIECYEEADIATVPFCYMKYSFTQKTKSETIA